MAEPFDLENQPPDPSQRLTGARPSGPRPPSTGTPSPSEPLRGQLPTTRASDMLKARSAPGGRPSGRRPSGGGPSSGPEPDIDRRATKFDDTASGLLLLSGLLFLAGVGYMLWGMWSGAFANPNWSSVYGHADRLRVVQVIQLCGTVMWYALSIATALFLFLFYHEEYCGYSLLIGALIMQFGINYLTLWLFGQMHTNSSTETDVIFQILRDQSWVIGIPGFILTALNIVKATIASVEEAKTKRSFLQFGQKAIKDHKPRNVFLGACWNLPYCKDAIRNKCPIFVKKSGPCWRNKRGCMCDQTILLVAQAPNWKQNVAATIGKLDGKTGMPAMPELPPQPQLSRQAKIERCRQCVIFNYHQEQKYKLIVALVLGTTLAGLVLYNGQMLGVTGQFFVWANDLLGRFSTSKNATALFPNGAPPFVEWLILSSLLLVAVAKILQFAEFVCFKLKM